MTALSDMLRLTKQLHQLFSENNSVADRDQLIQSVHALLDQRATVMPNIQPPETPDEQRQMKVLMDLDEQIKQDMNNFLQTVKQGIHSNKLQRKSNHSYTNPYQHIQVADGQFVDRKN